MKKTILIILWILIFSISFFSDDKAMAQLTDHRCSTDPAGYFINCKQLCVGPHCLSSWPERKLGSYDVRCSGRAGGLAGASCSIVCQQGYALTNLSCSGGTGYQLNMMDVRGSDTAVCASGLTSDVSMTATCVATF